MFNETKSSTTSGEDPGGAYRALIRSVHRVLTARGDPLLALVGAAASLAPYVRLDLLGEREIYLALHAAFYWQRNDGKLNQQSFDQRFKLAVNTGWSHNPGWSPEPDANGGVTLDEIIDQALIQLRSTWPRLRIAS